MKLPTNLICPDCGGEIDDGVCVICENEPDTEEEEGDNE
jgi:hypothetical protein